MPAITVQGIDIPGRVLVELLPSLDLPLTVSVFPELGVVETLTGSEPAGSNEEEFREFASKFLWWVKVINFRLGVLMVKIRI